MKQILSMWLMLVCMATVGQAQSGAISGTVYDETQNQIVGAIVEVIQKGKIIRGSSTGSDGKYLIQFLKAGKYDVKVKYTGYHIIQMKNVMVLADRTTYQNFSLMPATTEREEVVIKEYKVPLVKKGEPGGTTTFTAEQIVRMPNINTNDVASLSAGTYQQKNAAPASLAGGRTSGALYIVDGIQASSRHRGEEARDRMYYNPSVEEFAKISENDFKMVKSNPLSTMSVDVDRASYSNVRRFINEGQKPPADAVRIEEMVNYFNYSYPQPQGEDPIAIVTEFTDCPWNKTNKLLRIGMQAQKIATKNLPASNFVFLIDVSGSMESANKLPLVKASLKMLVNKLRSQDHVAIVVYAGNAGLVLPSTSGAKKSTIIDALERLQAGGSTAGGAGIKLAYSVAMENFVEGGNNRVIIATDGDFNVGVSGANELEDLITKERKKGIFLTCLGFGMGNYKDNNMELLADKGNGNYAYIDKLGEAQKTLVHEFGGTLFTVAKDVKAQIEFNPNKVQAYRLVGYENRLLNEEDFKDDKKDAGEMGSDHQVTILYEIIPAGVESRQIHDVNPLKYQIAAQLANPHNGELATVKFRYKKPDGNVSREMSHTIADRKRRFAEASDDTRFASAVALFGMLLRDSKFALRGDYDEVLDIARDSKGDDEQGYRAEFIKLVRNANAAYSVK
ncbi:MAG TPA: von Willebrand factor type A domain-containing protein [Flavipsychrobacter sp.]|nr:von Willebrand factor type A domain-containing protein [Flavipsychrobacter sp.]